MPKMFEFCNQEFKNGRRHFKALLYILQPPECVIDGVGTLYNKNGITFLEKYSAQQLDSIKDMSVTVSFLDEERTLISDHGFTGMNSEDGMPTFDDATTVGHFTRGYIDDVEIDGEMYRAVFGEGYLDEMRYHAFVGHLIEELNNGYGVEGSIEIYRDANHDSIVYEYGYKEKGRIPMYFIHSGWTFVLNAADTNSRLIEINNHKEEQIKMDENRIVEVIQKTIHETNDAKEKYEQQIAELNTAIQSKDQKISELESEKVSVETESAKKDAKISELESKCEKLEQDVRAKDDELNECKKKELNSALDTKLSDYSADEQKYAEVEINAFREDPLKGDVDAIIMKINAGIGAKAKSDVAKAAEQNSAQDKFTNAIFSEINSDDSDDDDESIF